MHRSCWRRRNSCVGVDWESEVNGIRWRVLIRWRRFRRKGSRVDGSVRRVKCLEGI